MVGFDSVLQDARERQQRSTARKDVQEAARVRSATVVHDNRVTNVRVEGANADPEEIAERVSRRLQNDARMEALAAHG